MKPFVVSMKGKLLMPCSERKARILLKEGKAKIFQRHPFTIWLLYPTGENVQPVSIGVDTKWGLEKALLTRLSVLRTTLLMRSHPGMMP